jgi:hypothetical protein
MLGLDEEQPLVTAAQRQPAAEMHPGEGMCGQRLERRFEEYVAARRGDRVVGLDVGLAAGLGIGDLGVERAACRLDRAEIRLCAARRGEVGGLALEGDAELEAAHEICHAADRRELEDLAMRPPLDIGAGAVTREDDAIGVEAGEGVGQRA